MIIISQISKNRKKNESRKAEGNSSQTYYEPVKKTQSHQHAPQPVTDLRELLKTLKNINPETEGSKTFSDMKNRAEQVKPAGANEYSKKDNYEETSSYEETVHEKYSYDSEDKSYDKEDKSYDASGKTFDIASSSFDEVKALEQNTDNNSGYMNTVRRIYQPNVAPGQKHERLKISILDTKQKLKNAIIASEILKRKYT